MVSRSQNIKHTQSLALAQHELSVMYGITLPTLNDTINHKFEVQAGVDNPNENAQIAYFGIGRGGTRSAVDYTLRNPDPRALSLYDHIPLRINDVNDRFTADNPRSNYRMRKTVMRDNETFYFYYLKVINDRNNLAMGVRDFDGLERDTGFYNANNIEEYLMNLNESNALNTTGLLQGEETLQSYLSITIDLPREDIDSVIEYFDDDSYGVISEMGLFFGKDSSVAEGGTTYTEALRTKIAYNQVFLPRNLTDIEKSFRNTMQIRNFYASRALG